MGIKEETKTEELDTVQDDVLDTEVESNVSDEEIQEIEDVSDEPEEVLNPTLDAVHNGNWTDLKTKIEKQVSDKIINRVELAKTEYLSKVRGI